MIVILSFLITLVFPTQASPNRELQSELKSQIKMAALSGHPIPAQPLYPGRMDALAEHLNAEGILDLRRTITPSFDWFHEFNMPKKVRGFLLNMLAHYPNEHVIGFLKAHLYSERLFVNEKLWTLQALAWSGFPDPQLIVEIFIPGLDAEAPMERAVSLAGLTLTPLQSQIIDRIILESAESRDPVLRAQFAYSVPFIFSRRSHLKKEAFAFLLSLTRDNNPLVQEIAKEAKAGLSIFSKNGRTHFCSQAVSKDASRKVPFISAYQPTPVTELQ